MVHRWSHPLHGPMTDRLLGEIEQSAARKVALGFDKGTAGSVNSHGKKVCDHYQEIAEAVFLADDISGWQAEYMPTASPIQFTRDDLPALATSVKSRVSRYDQILIDIDEYYLNSVSRLKALYTRHRSELSETGKGLVDADREGEITPGSNLANIWGMLPSRHA